MNWVFRGSLEEDFIVLEKGDFEKMGFIYAANPPCGDMDEMNPYSLMSYVRNRGLEEIFVLGRGSLEKLGPLYAKGPDELRAREAQEKLRDIASESRLAQIIYQIIK